MYNERKERYEPFELRKIQQNSTNRTACINIPSSYLRRLKLSRGQVCTISLVEDEDNSRLVIAPVRIPTLSREFQGS